ncbi:MAG TPA: hypothetical protein PKI61_01320 [bacterium]|nr:hypothetical protein [bacterium]HPT29528.1 hypothetical protein [bacterium]
MEIKPRVYRQKLIESGDYVEIYDFENFIKINQKRKKRRNKNKIKKDTNDEDKENEQNLKSHFSLRRSRSNIIRLVNSNPDLKVFITLTFDSHKFGDKPFTDFKECNLIFSNFIKRLKRKYPELKYLAVPEFQSDYYHRTNIRKEFGGNIHYHLLSNLPFIQSEELEKIWGYGFIKINNIRQVSAVGPYVAKYIGKELFDGRLNGKKKLFYSRTLNRSKIVITYSRIKEYLNNLKSPLQLLHETTYQAEYVGRVRYRLYKQR